MTSAHEKQVLRKKWVEMLRSGEFTQTRRELFDGTGYCCLGIACLAAGIEPDENLGFLDENLVLPDEVQRMFGIASEEGRFASKLRSKLDENGHFPSLARLNDEGASFSEIADVIESNPPGLFADEARS